MRTAIFALRSYLLKDSAEAMDRIHRLGQRRPVQAIKLVIEDSIESRIIQVCRNYLPQYQQDFIVR